LSRPAFAFISQGEYPLSLRTLRHVPRPVGVAGRSNNVFRPASTGGRNDRRRTAVMLSCANATAEKLEYLTVSEETWKSANGATEKSPVQNETKHPSKMRGAVMFSQLLALNAGMLNGIFLSGIMGRKQAVGPVTDSWTKFGLAICEGNIQNVVFIASVLCSFGLGGLLVGLANPDTDVYDLEKRRRPLLMAASVLATATVFAAKAASTGGVASIPRQVFFLVSMANGMQNSFTSTLTQHWCRSTHMTGTTTDLFTIIGQVLRGNTKNRFKIPIYAGCLSMFALGGILAGTFATNLSRVVACLTMSTSLYLISVFGPMVWRGSRSKQAADVEGI